MGEERTFFLCVVAAAVKGDYMLVVWCVLLTRFSLLVGLVMFLWSDPLCARVSIDDNGTTSSSGFEQKDID